MLAAKEQILKAEAQQQKYKRNKKKLKGKVKDLKQELYAVRESTTESVPHMATHPQQDFDMG